MIIITGGAGFIGSNYIKYLNDAGFKEIIVVDNFKNGRKFQNLADLSIVDVIQKEDFFESKWFRYSSKKIKKIIHLGACSSTQEWDGIYLLKNNYEYSKKLLYFSIENCIDFIYASSASVYGLGDKGFKENEEFLNPINAYAYTKYIFDNFVKYTLEKSNAKSKIIGLRFFNVYGPGEYFKGEMCSPVYKFYNQIKKNGYCKIFDSYGGYERGMHLRDFINVLDCCKIIDFVSASSTKLNIFNVGTSKPVSFLKIAKTVLDYLNLDQNQIEFIPFPNH